MDQDKTDVPVARVRCTHVYYSVFKCYATDTRFSFLLLMSIVFKASKFRNRISFFSAYYCKNWNVFFRCDMMCTVLINYDRHSRTW